MPPRSRPAGTLHEPYEALKRLAHTNLRSPETCEQLLRLAVVSLNFLTSECREVNLTSLIPDKEYFSYARRSAARLLSRPINRALFEPNTAAVRRQWRAWWRAEPLGQETVARLSYTMAMAYCAAIDLFDRGNKKGPATYFECLVGHLFARALGVNPTKKATLPVLGRQIRMTMDFIFDLRPSRVRVHLPVKMSTRERVVQAWAHQGLLDASYGRGQFRGILVVFSETKLDLVTREVVEICVPDQWLAYQVLLARMDRIYYFDVPQRYADLATAYPVVQLKQFADFFAEKEEVLAAPLP